MIDKQTWRKTLDKIHRVVGATAIGSKLALKVANQCNAVIRARFNSGTDPTSNGEELLISHVGSSISTFFDVGANNGQWVSMATQHAALARGVCFEPLLSAQARLSITLAGLQGVHWRPHALGDQVARAEFFECEAHTDMSSLVQTSGLHEGNRYAVDVSTVDIELEKTGWPELDFLKIDVEGYDFHVLRGASGSLASGLVGLVQFEYSSFWRLAGSTLRAAVEYLETSGYEVYLLKEDGLYELPTEDWGEYYGYSNYVAVSEKWKDKVALLVRREFS